MLTQIISHTPGQVLWTICEDEDNLATSAVKVEKGDILLCIEVCKAQNEIVSPVPGYCIFYVRAGEVVGQGKVLAVVSDKLN